MKKPSFDISELDTSKSLQKCKGFLTLLRDSNVELQSQISNGDLDKIIDSNIQLYRGDTCPEEGNCFDGSEGDIILDVGVGVFDVKGTATSEEALREQGITTVNVDDSSHVFKHDEPLVTEIDRTATGKP